LAGNGVTSIQDAWVEPDDVDVYSAAVDAGLLRVRTNLAFRAEPGQWPTQRDPFRIQRQRVEDLGDSSLSARTIKFFIDGCIEEGTANLLSPYIDCPHSRGIPNWDREDLKDALCAFDADGFQLHIHAIGDAGVRDALDAIEFLRARNPPRDRRAVIAHAQLVAPQDVPRFAKLEVIANFQPFWAQLDPMQTVLTLPRLGPERGNQQYPIRSVIRSGGAVSFGSDWPCGFYSPLAGISKAITRSFEGHSGAWVSGECLTLEQAITAYTHGSAFQSFAEDEWGDLEVGRWADLVVLGEDPRDVNPNELSSIPVISTWVAGQMIHGNPSAGVSQERNEL
jgi:predicted amidohydrolase YtcJ